MPLTPASEIKQRVKGVIVVINLCRHPDCLSNRGESSVPVVGVNMVIVIRNGILSCVLFCPRPVYVLPKQNRFFWKYFHNVIHAELPCDGVPHFFRKKRGNPKHPDKRAKTTTG